MFCLVSRKMRLNNSKDIDTFGAENAESAGFDNSTTVMRIDEDKDVTPFDSSTTVMHPAFETGTKNFS